MISIKLPIQNKIDITDIQRQWNSVVRFSYNRFKEDSSRKLKHVEPLAQSMNNIGLLNSTIIRYAVLKGWEFIRRKGYDGKVIFGGNLTFNKRKYNEISKDEYKKEKLLPIHLIGDADRYGNRLFRLDIKENNRVFFRPDRVTKVEILLPKLKKNIKTILYALEDITKTKTVPYTINLTNEYVTFSFDEKILKTSNHIPIENRILALDSNPNQMAYVICDVDKSGIRKIIHKEIIDFYDINYGIVKYSQRLPYSDPNRMYANRKRHNETLESAHRIIKIAKSFKVESIILEDLSSIPRKTANINAQYNILVQNNWNRRLLSKTLEKLANINDIYIRTIFPSYSSFIGQMQHPELPDSIGAALEMTRRGYVFIEKYIKNKNTNPPESKEKIDLVGEYHVMYPKFLIESLPTRWKKMATERSIKNWKELYDIIKKSKMVYRVLWMEWKKTNSFKSFRLKSKNSLLTVNIL